MKIALATTAVVVALFAAVAATASPAQPVGNFISLHLGPAVGQFRGAVHSDVLKCIKNRKVKIVRISGQDVRVGKGFTDSRGHFNIQTTESSGDWISKVKKQKFAQFTCAGARSKIRSAG
jgi:hypothetical protein